MKRLITLASAVVISIFLFGSQAPAKDRRPSSPPERTVEQCQQQLDDIIGLVQTLDATKAKNTNKIRKDLLKKLEKAQDQLADGGESKYYKAAKNVFDVLEDMIDLTVDDKVDFVQAIAIIDLLGEEQDCIVELYLPDYKCLDCP